MKNKWLWIGVAAAVLLVSGVSLNLSFNVKSDPSTSTQVRTVNLEWADTIKMFATELADDKYEGRNAGYSGNEKAAKYIVAELTKAGFNVYSEYFSFRSFYTGQKDFNTRNVVAVLEGTDPVLKDEIVVIGAHFDHVGKVSEGQHFGRIDGAVGDDEIFNGADDNASGTAAMMTIALALKSGKITTKRTIMFIAFSAEEAGLHGSLAYCEAPLFDINNHVFMINLDMIGRNPDKPVEIKGMGSAVGDTIANIVAKATAQQGLKAALDNGSDIDGGDSDHSSFRGVGIPFIFFFTGFHPDYHKVTDHADKLAYDHIATIAKTAAQVAIEVANLDKRPVFQR